MLIKRFVSRQFAGLKDIEINFAPGLNVIVGANETGKSTLISAIWAVLFINTSLKKNRSEDKEFLARYMPYPSGDFIDGGVHFIHQDQEYRLFKLWGNKNQTDLRKPDGLSVTVESDIDEFLKTIFELGPKTYQNIVFAHQNQLKDILAKLRDRETVHSINSLLRQAVMNLDGVSTDTLRVNIDTELEQLLKRWDYQNNRPEDSKIYKTGVGTVLSSFYTKSRLEQEMNRVKNLEKELHQLGVQLHEWENRYQAGEKELKNLEPLEEDITARLELEPRLMLLKSQSAELKAVSVEWPQTENTIKNKDKELQRLVEQMEQVSREENACRNRREQETLAQIIKKVDENQEQIARINQQKNGLAKITVADVQRLEQLSQKMTTALVSMKAGKMLASIHPAQEIDIWVSNDLEPERRLETREIESNGYLKFRIADLADIEIKSGEFDFTQIKADYTQADIARQDLLKQLGVDKLEEAQMTISQRDNLDREIAALEQLTKSLLAGQSYEEIKTKLEQMGKIDITRTLELIQKEKSALNIELVEAKTDLKSARAKLQSWTDKYESQTKLFETVINLEIDIRGLEAEIARLQPLPGGFSSAADFRYHIKNLRTQLSQWRTELAEIRKNHDEKERELPEESYEDLKQQYELACKQLSRHLARADRLVKIKKAFTETLEEMESDPLQPLADAFSRYLARSTRGHYELGLLGEDLAIEIVSKDSVKLPANLLSAGTYDCAALSLRFAMLEQIFAQGDGFTILDDCLVDLDPDRRAEAVKIIQEYAVNNQVIFTTCSPDTASLLGGKMIELNMTGPGRSLEKGERQ